MLRIHFTDTDLARTRVAAAPDPLWETLLALHRLSGRAGRPSRALADWRGRARAELTDRGLVGAARLVLSLAPPQAAYFPDFLTPAETSAGLAAGLEAVRGCAAERVREEVMRTVRISGGGRAPTCWERSLAGGDRERLAEVAGALRELHGAIVRPGWARVGALGEADRALRARALRDGGVEALLDSLRPAAVWEPPVLRAGYPVEYDLRLGGRGLLLVPSCFCSADPVALADPALPPVLVYPVRRGAAYVPDAAAVEPRAAALGRLLGRTRARVLAALECAATTGELARRLAVSPATASEHVRALREAELAGSVRDGGAVLHTLTPLGAALLRGGEAR